VRVRHRVAVGGLIRRRAEQDPAHRDLHLLAGQGDRDGVHRDDPVGHMPRRVLAAEPFGDRALERAVQDGPVGQRDEQWHEEPAARQVEVDDERVRDLLDGLQGRVDLCGADADAMPVQGRVAATQDEAAAAVVDLEEVALPPEAREVGEVRPPVPLAVLVVP
jgi:hypothetical protein